MSKEITIDRAYYFSIKKHYLFWKTLLIIMRFLSAFLLVSIITYIVYYSNAKELSEKQRELYNTLSNIAKLVVPTFIVCWIIIKMIVILFTRKLRNIKKNVEVIDEI